MTLYLSRLRLGSVVLALVAAWTSLTIPSEAAVIGFFNAPGSEQTNDLFDNFLIARLEDQGHTIVRASDGTEFDDAIFADTDMFIISDDVSSGDIGAVIDSSGLLDPRPVIMYETGAMDNYKIGDGESYRFALDPDSTQTDIDTRNVVITDPSSPLAGGFSGTVELYNFGIGFGPARLHGVRAGDGIALAPGFQTVATTVPSNNDGDPFFVPFVDGAFVPSDTIATLGFVPQGGELNDGTFAAGLRIIAFLNDSEDPDLEDENRTMTDDARTLVDAITGFALSSISGGPLADFDSDNDVDGNDFLVWQRGFGTTLNATDLANWEAEFGTVPSGVTVTAVPEPASWLLVCLMTMTLGVWRRTTSS